MAEPFLCAICGGSIPSENDDTVVWPDVRYQQKEQVSPSGEKTTGPFLTAHPTCFELVRGPFNEPCPACDSALAPIPGLAPRVGRWACSGCRREYGMDSGGRLRGDDA